MSSIAIGFFFGMLNVLLISFFVYRSLVIKKKKLTTGVVLFKYVLLIIFIYILLSLEAVDVVLFCIGFFVSTVVLIMSVGFYIWRTSDKEGK